jgi:hypothetical protein
LWVAIVGCSDPPAVTEASGGAVPPWGSAAKPPPPRQGMLWIPEGTLVAGTPADAVPRVPDAEMPAVPVPMRGFFIDRFPHPNEQGAIATTNITRDDAQTLCEAEGKRLCTELELERACKGPNNTRYAYGDAHRADVCGTYGRRILAPNGLNALCKSAFGVHDLHGAVWVWTSSDWGRGTTGLAAIRGGNGRDGEVAARCANGASERPAAKRADLGVRCCAGPENPARVELEVERGPALKFRVGDEAIARRIEEPAARLASLDDGPVVAGVAARPPDGAEGLRVERTWAWRPAGNEELLLGGGCTPGARKKVCGILVVRERGAALTPLAFVSTDKWQPTLSETDSPREIFVHGGDDNGAFRKRVSYEWGRIGIGDKERRKRRKKGKPRYE